MGTCLLREDNEYTAGSVYHTSFLDLQSSTLSLKQAYFKAIMALREISAKRNTVKVSLNM
jgi:hypothetical protein